MQKDKIAKQWSAAPADGCALFLVQCISSSAELNAKGYKTMLYYLVVHLKYLSLGRWFVLRVENISMQQCGKADFALKEWLAEQFKSALECHCPVHCLQFQDQANSSALQRPVD